jgi:cobalt-zinc-cadmium efflux system membrane fusion protein
MTVNFRRSLLGLALLASACGEKKAADPAAEAPPKAIVENTGDKDIFHVENSKQFPLFTASSQTSTTALNATGVVSADVSRTVPVISLAAGRIIEVNARLGDTVRKGQLLLKVQSADISGAFADYQQAQADESLARSQYERSKALFDKGAIAKKDLEVAENVENKAKVTVATTSEKIRILGADIQHPNAILSIRAPISGVITDQQVTNAAGTQGLASLNPFTISDLSAVWIICDIYENDLAQVKVGEYADVRLNAYPEMILKGRISKISPVLDPALRTAKVRLEMRNPGVMRLGMFVTATFHGAKTGTVAAVPATAVLHLHDRDFVYVPASANHYRRVEVTGGLMLAGNMQEIKSGIAPGQAVVSNALVLQNTVEQ